MWKQLRTTSSAAQRTVRDADASEDMAVRLARDPARRGGRVKTLGRGRRCAPRRRPSRPSLTRGHRRRFGGGIPPPPTDTRGTTGGSGPDPTLAREPTAQLVQSVPMHVRTSSRAPSRTTSERPAWFEVPRPQADARARPSDRRSEISVTCDQSREHPCPQAAKKPTPHRTEDRILIREQGSPAWPCRAGARKPELCRDPASGRWEAATERGGLQ